MFKVMWLMKRKDGTSMQDFIDYYEKHHSVLAKKLFEANSFKPVKYMRKYLHPLADPIPESENPEESDYDVAMELWFESREQFDRMVEFSMPEEVREMIIADERNFLNRDIKSVFILEEHETTFD